MPSRRTVLVSAATASLGALVGCIGSDGESPPTPTAGPGTGTPSFGEPTLSSAAFDDGEPVPKAYTCSGADRSPPLTVGEVPLEAETVEELDGATQGTNSRGTMGYVGPCPPPDDGAHTYRFTLYALDSTLGIDPGAERSVRRPNEAARRGGRTPRSPPICTYTGQPHSWPS